MFDNCGDVYRVLELLDTLEEYLWRVEVKQRTPVNYLWLSTVDQLNEVIVWKEGSFNEKDMKLDLLWLD